MLCISAEVLSCWQRNSVKINTSGKKMSFCHVKCANEVYDMAILSFQCLVSGI